MKGRGHLICHELSRLTNYFGVYGYRKSSFSFVGWDNFFTRTSPFLSLLEPVLNGDDLEVRAFTCMLPLNFWCSYSIVSSYHFVHVSV